jgi:hypothetical protein
MEYPDGSLVVSFTRALSSPKHELERFIIYDTATSFILGVPPLVEYGYNNDSRCVSHGFEWIHGIPFALIEVISQINSWRAGSRAPPLDNWQILERYILAWQPQLTPSDGVESATGCVARLAVQESWRHVVLIYLYMVSPRHGVSVWNIYCNDNVRVCAKSHRMTPAYKRQYGR